MKKEYITIKIKDIKPYDKNPRKNDAAVPYVAESIKQVGYITPIEVALSGACRSELSRLFLQGLQA